MIELKKVFKVSFKVSAPWSTNTNTYYFIDEESLDKYIQEELPKLTNLVKPYGEISRSYYKTSVLLIKHENEYYSLGEQVFLQN